MSLALCAAGLLSGCATGSHAERGALLGTTLGAIGGGIIGHQTGHTGDGALLGALAGGVTGAVVGDAKDDRDAALAHAAAADAQAQQAVTNADLIMMTQQGISDQVIVQTVRTRGGRLDLSPASIIDLKNNGVSDTVILGIQQAAQPAGPSTVVPAGGTSSSVVIVRPRPVVGVVVGPPPRPRPPRPRHYHIHW